MSGKNQLPDTKVIFGEALDREVSGWEKVEAEELWHLGWTGSQAVLMRDKEAVKLSLPGRVENTGKFWGWLGAGQREPGGDRWSIYLEVDRGKAKNWYDQPDEVLGWVEVLLPLSWTGELNTLIFREHPISGGLVGGFDRQIEHYNWISSIREGNTPTWPKLGKGVIGNKPEGEMVLLGVIRSENEANAPTWEGELRIAWGNQAGEFLGWEKIESMLELFRLGEDPKLVRVFRPHWDWDNLEAKLREASLGREL